MLSFLHLPKVYRTKPLDALEDKGLIFYLHENHMRTGATRQYCDAIKVLLVSANLARFEPTDFPSRAVKASSASRREET